MLFLLWLNNIPLLPGFVNKGFLVNSHTRIGKPIDGKQSSVFGEGEKEMGVATNGAGIPDWAGDAVLELRGGGGCTLSLYLLPLRCGLFKMV